jgi:tRNA pseudouridine38-40 synthase
MPHWKATLTYDGTPYNGWQVQPNLPTVQGTLTQAIRRITGETLLPQGSGRTDTGVHALGQVATFSLTVPIPADNLLHALNRALPSSIRVLSIEAVPSTFHARYSALRKTYEYRILPGNRICSPMLAPFVWACPHELDLHALQQAASHILGTHDFTSFAAADPDLTTRNKIASITDNVVPEPSTLDPSYFAQLNSDLATATDAEDSQIGESIIATNAGASAAISKKPISLLLPPLSRKLPAYATNTRTIHHSTWTQQEDLLIYRITGSGFLHHMVRNLVGTFVEAAIGRISPDAIPAILAARNRSTAGPTAPARGLFLAEVIY